MKKILFLATVLVMLASCADESFVGDKNLKEANEHSSIGFNMSVPAMTRADKTGALAATDLNNTFYVYGIKKESVDGAGNVQAGNFVFNNYVVKWVNNTAFTTTSNTENWEYVGYTLSAKELANITTNSGAVAQTIKYWDFGADDYTFYAFSALPADIENDRVVVTKVQNKKTTDDPAHTVYDNGYTVTLAAGASLDDLFFSERVHINQSDNTDRTADNTYGGNVTFRFHRMSTKVRVAMYETIPGYSVTINKFSVDNDGADPAFNDMTDDVTANFAANFQNCAANTTGNMTVTYQSSGSTENHPCVSFDGTAAKVLTLGTQLAANTTIGETVTTATYDQTSKAYTSVFPKENNSQNLKLKLTYTLTAPVTNETIVVSDATAVIPAQYLTWKPGYAYTYIFKITDDKLYPITFDAVEVVDEDGVQETITTVATPSITTYAKGAIVGSHDEYTAGSNIYVVVKDGEVLTTSNAKLYAVTLTNTLASGDEGYHDAAAQSITEATVANILANGTKDDDTNPTTWTKTDANNWQMQVNTTSAPTLNIVTQIAADDSPTGIAIDINGAKFTPAAPTYSQVTSGTSLTEGKTYYTSAEGDGAFVAGSSDTAGDSTYEKTSTGAGYYAFEYEAAAVDAVYTVIPSGTISAGTKYYTEDGDVYTEHTADADISSDGSSQYTLTTPAKPATKYYKVIKVVD